MKRKHLHVVNDLVFNNVTAAYFLAYVVIDLRKNKGASFSRLYTDVLGVFKRKYGVIIPMKTAIKFLRREREKSRGVVGSDPRAARNLMHLYLVVREDNLSVFMTDLIKKLNEEDEDNDVFRILGVDE